MIQNQLMKLGAERPGHWWHILQHLNDIYWHQLSEEDKRALGLRANAEDPSRRQLFVMYLNQIPLIMPY
jgi:hypothetical protein